MTTPLAVAQGSQEILVDLSALAQKDVTKLLKRVNELPSDVVFSYLTDAYPALMKPYVNASSTLAMQDYNSLGSRMQLVPVTPTDETLAANARWAMTTLVPDQNLMGSAMRQVLNSYRGTILKNTSREPGARFARYASANACGFCRMLATRGAVYAKDTATKSGDGSRYHDHCRCMAVAVRPGKTYEPPGYVAEWEQAYKKASRESGDPAEIAKLMVA